MGGRGRLAQVKTLRADVVSHTLLRTGRRRSSPPTREIVGRLRNAGAGAPAARARIHTRPNAERERGDCDHSDSVGEVADAIRRRGHRSGR